MVGDSLLSVLPWLLASLLVSPGALAKAKDVVHLDFSPLRGGEPDSDHPHRNGTENSPETNDTRVYCTDNKFPGDIFCDITSMGRGMDTDIRPFTTAIYLKFPHPSKPKVECFISFGNSIEGEPSKVHYRSHSCYNPTNSTSEWLSNVEWQMKIGEVATTPDDGSLPEKFKVGAVTVLEVEDSSLENLALKCKRRSKKAQGGAPPARSSSVAFDVEEMACISTALPPERPMLPGVQTEAAP